MGLILSHSLGATVWAGVLVLSPICAQAGRSEIHLTTLHSFGLIDGANPQAGLVEGKDGYFYGTTFSGGTNGEGTVYKISSDGALTTLYSFSGGNDGASPRGTLLQNKDGYFYGTTAGGGFYLHYGTVFKISSDGALSTLYSFTGGNDGANPQAGLVQGNDGFFYGTTLSGGENGGHGTVFKISSEGALTTLHTFTGGNDGASPDAGVVQGRDGNFYGTTQSGGANFRGTVFKISSSGELTTLHTFRGDNDGSSPAAGLVLGKDGDFYGTAGGGIHGCGVVFKISSEGALTNLYAFTCGNDGYFPQSGLVQGQHGYFYGTTSNGGANEAGNVFKISSEGNLTNLYSFTGGNDGAFPITELVQGDHGDFYGTTSYGGTNDASGLGYGTVFKLDVPRNSDH